VTTRPLPLRVGVIGIGFGQHVHVPAFRADPRVRVEAICATSTARARAVADRLSIPRAYGDWHALVDDPELDVITVSVPPPAQALIALSAARAGKHLFAEKPLATTADQASAIVDAAEASGVVGAMDFEFRAVPAWQRAREIIHGGELGQIRSAFIAWRIETMAYRTGGHGWKVEQGGGGGTLNLFASHSLDSVLWLLGPVRRLATRLHPATGAEARAELWLELDSGASVSISIAADLPGGSGHRVEVYGDAGSLFLDNRSNDYIAGFELFTTKRSQPPSAVDLPKPRPGEDGRIVAVGELARWFIDAIERRGPMSPSLADGLAVQRLLDLARATHRSQTWSS
jgi:predicted dehydrogenase